MPKYKKVNEGVIDKFLDKIFNSAAKKMQSSAIKKLSKADPQFKKDYDVLLKARDKMEKNLKAKGLTSADVAAQWVAKRAAQRRRGEQVEEAEKKPVVKKKVTPKKATPKKVTPKKAVPKKGTPKKGTPEKPKKPPVKKKFDVSKAKKNPKALKRFITKTKLKTGEKNAKGEPKEVSLSSILSNKKHKLYKKALAMKNKFIEKDSKRLDKDEKSKTVRKKKSDTKASDDAGDALAAFFGRPK